MLMPSVDFQEFLNQVYKEYKTTPIPMPCRAGCSSCCEHDMHASVSWMEAERICLALDKLPSIIQNNIYLEAERQIAGIGTPENETITPRQLQLIQDQWSARDMPCPLLYRGLCSVYESRPVVCATFGRGVKEAGFDDENQTEYAYNVCDLCITVIEESERVERPWNNISFTERNLLNIISPVLAKTQDGFRVRLPLVLKPLPWWLVEYHTNPGMFQAIRDNLTQLAESKVKELMAIKSNAQSELASPDLKPD